MNSLEIRTAANTGSVRCVKCRSRYEKRGSSKAGLVSATGPADEDDKDPEDRRDQPSGERLA